MQELVKNKLFLIVAAFMALNVCLFFGGKIVVDRAADEVIERLQKDYSPSPYGPGIDPDRVNPSTLQPQTQPQPQTQSQPKQMVQLSDSRSYLELRHVAGGQQQEEIQFAPTLGNITQDASMWRNDWEAERGFSHVQ